MAAIGAVVIGGKNLFLEGLKDTTNLRTILYTEAGGTEVFDVANTVFGNVNESTSRINLNASLVFNVSEGKTVQKLAVYSSGNASHNPSGQTLSDWNTAESPTQLIAITLNTPEEFVTAGTFTLTSLQVAIVDPT